MPDSKGRMIIGAKLALLMMTVGICRPHAVDIRDIAMKSKILGLVAIGLSTLPMVAGAITLGFTRITNNSSTNVASQLSVEVTAAGSNQVAFKFLNNVGAAASITDVYFDDGTLLGISTITMSGGVAFAQFASPGDLPGGNAVGFVTTQGFSADSAPPVLANGVNTASEWLTVTFNLINGKTFADTVAALIQATGEGSLRIGIHVQGIGTDGNSDAFVNVPPEEERPPVPEPGTLGLLGLGLVGLGLARRRRTA